MSFQLKYWCIGNWIFKISLLCLIFLLGQSSKANNIREVRSQNHGWYMYFGNHRLAKSWSLHTEYQWRRANWITDWQQSLARIGLDFRLKENFVITAGYGLIHTYPYGDFPVMTTFLEHRIWQQINTTNQIGRFTFGHRFRLEQRWSQHISAPSHGETMKHGFDYSNRFRFMINVIVPLNKPKIESGVLFFRFYDEAFINFGKQVKLNIFDQNRLFGALGFQFSNQGNLQLGYMNQLLIKSDGIRVENNHTLQVLCIYNFDLRKKD